MASATVKVWEVLHDVAGPGEYGDGMAVARFRSERDARAFASSQRCYGSPAEAKVTDAPRNVAARWGVV
jgi:hypothetical protein